jgi:hypothetical protein
VRHGPAEFQPVHLRHRVIHHQHRRRGKALRLAADAVDAFQVERHVALVGRQVLHVEVDVQRHRLRGSLLRSQCSAVLVSWKVLRASMGSSWNDRLRRKESLSSTSTVRSDGCRRAVACVTSRGGWMGTAGAGDWGSSTKMA